MIMEARVLAGWIEALPAEAPETDEAARGDEASLDHTSVFR
jgi:hypothetical protein